MNPRQTTERIRSASDLAAVISGYTRLQRRGNSQWARCPFHEERTASLEIDTRKQVWNCFSGCGGGDVFAFVQRIEGLSFHAARKLLAERAGIAIDEQSPAPLLGRQRVYAEQLAAETAWWWAWVRRRYVERENQMWSASIAAERALIDENDGDWGEPVAIFNRRGWRWRRIIEKLDAADDPNGVIRAYLRYRRRNPRIQHEYGLDLKCSEVIKLAWTEWAMGPRAA